MEKVVVIGGGIIGLSSAYFLHKAGFQVTVIDKSAMDAGASYVNAGYLTPSHIIPLASPGMIGKGLKWMFNSASPFYLKPRWDPEFFQWAWYFYRASNKSNVERAIPIIRDINLLSRELFEEVKASGDLGDFQLERQGLLMLYQNEKEGEREKEVARRAYDIGLEVRELSMSEVSSLEPDVNINSLGAVHYLCDGHTTPTEFMPLLKNYLSSNGVQILEKEEVTGFSLEGDIISGVKTNKNFYRADHVILAAGSWSSTLAKQLGLALPLQAGKGYSINVNRPTGIRLPAVLMDAKVAVTPMRGFTRFAGTMEFSGINKTIRKERVEAISKAAERFYPGLKITSEEKSNARSGLRPVSPDGLPYIGRSQKAPNVTFATGHAMMGWSLGPATGKLVAEIISGEKPSMDIRPFSPDRKF